MVERAEYEKNLEELGSEEEEDLEVFDQPEVSGDEDAMEEDVLPPQDKGKSRMVEKEVPETEKLSEKPKKEKQKSLSSSLSTGSVSATHTPDQSGQSTPLPTAGEVQKRKAGKKAKRKEKKSSS
ncbi:hypothetical protein BDR04DRAFT_1139047 [Suillus decipiens]|nr:hypothetical protein BDR04DRAFT_1139047 [Suillus decipiens]